MSNVRSNWVATLAALIIAITGLVVSLNIDTTPTPDGGSHKTITFKVDKSTEEGVQTGTVEAPAPVVQAIEPNLEDQLEDETPTGITPEQAQAVQQSIDQTKQTLPGLPTSGATAGVPGCRTQFVVNQSSRHGVRPTEFVLHYTVSPNIPGWGDVYSVVNLFNRSASQASSNFVEDAEGHCAYIVPIENKAWTQAAGNPFSVSVEIIATGRETALCTGPCMKQLRTIFKTVSGRTGIPGRLGRVSNCQPVRSGIIQHKDWGLCGGGHFDVTPFSSKAVTAQIIAGAKPTKLQTWVHRRQVDHLQYVKYCHTRAQRRTNAKRCVDIRTHARRLDTLIKRETTKKR